jgi:hypothetical protein
MPVPYLLFVEGVVGAGVVDPFPAGTPGPLPGANGIGTARDLIALPAGDKQSLPRVALETFSITSSGSGSGSSMTFTITQPDVSTTYAITNVSGNGTTVTYTAANNLAVGSVVSITGVTPSGYNLTKATVASASSTQFTVTNAATGAYSSGGSVAIVPWFLAMADMAPIRFYDTRYSATQPILLGYVTNVQARMRALGIEVQVTGADPINWMDKILVRKGKIGTGRQAVGTITLSTAARVSDKATINELLYYVDLRSDAATRRLINTSPISGSGKTAVRALFPGYNPSPAVNISSEVKQLPVSTLRGAMDTVSEAAGGFDTVARKYWIDGNGRINYNARTAPAQATAPFEIVTVASQVNPTGSGGTTTSKIAATGLQVQYDHEQVIKRAFLRCGDFDSGLDDATDPYTRTYNLSGNSGPGLGTRNGPRPDALIDLPDVKGLTNTTRDNFIDKFGNGMLAIRYQPMRSVRITVVGADLTQTANPAHDFGYTQGYHYNGSTYNLVRAVLPDQWIKVNAPQLGIAGEVLRIEAVTWSFAKGTTEASLEIECDWRRKGLIERIG